MTPGFRIRNPGVIRFRRFRLRPGHRPHPRGATARVQPIPARPVRRPQQHRLRARVLPRPQQQSQLPRDRSILFDPRVAHVVQIQPVARAVRDRPRITAHPPRIPMMLLRRRPPTARLADPHRPGTDRRPRRGREAAHSSSSSAARTASAMAIACASGAADTRSRTRRSHSAITARGTVEKRRCLSFGGDGASAQENAVAEQGEAGTAVHLARDALGLGVHVFGAAVVVGQGDGRTDGIATWSRPRVKACR